MSRFMWTGLKREEDRSEGRRARWSSSLRTTGLSLLSARCSHSQSLQPDQQWRAHGGPLDTVVSPAREVAMAFRRVEIAFDQQLTGVHDSALHAREDGSEFGQGRSVSTPATAVADGSADHGLEATTYIWIVVAQSKAMQRSQVPIGLDKCECGCRLLWTAWTIVKDEGQVCLCCRIVRQKCKIHKVFDQDPDG
jgi:hypothetical protein